MSLNKLFVNLPLKLNFQNVTARRYWFSKSSSNIVESAEERPVFAEEEEVIDNVELERKRNKSKLSAAHRNIVHGRRPYNEAMAWYHNTIRYKKRMLGRYGLQSLEVPAGLAWPTPKEVEEMKEYEKIAFPLTIQERLSKIKEQKRLHEESIMARQQEIESNMAKMENMITEIQERVAKKEAELLEAQQKKQMKIEEIRRKLLAEGHVSATKIEQALADMAKDEKKKKKEAKKAKLIERQKQWAEKLLAQELTTVNQQNDAVEDAEQSKTDKD